jgi:hypothetical protein
LALKKSEHLHCPFVTPFQLVLLRLLSSFLFPGVRFRARLGG